MHIKSAYLLSIFKKNMNILQIIWYKKRSVLYNYNDFAIWKNVTFRKRNKTKIY